MRQDRAYLWRVNVSVCLSGDGAGGAERAAGAGLAGGAEKLDGRERSEWG